MNTYFRWRHNGIRFLQVLLCSLTVTFLSAQSKTISGVITDAGDGTTLPGVTILVKGTSRGAISDIDGKYTLSAAPEDVLLFTYIGFKSLEENVGQRSVIDVSLSDDVQELSEIVVIGYGQVEKGDVTGVVSKIDSKEFNKGMLTSPEQLLAGKVAGVQVSSNSGEPGGGITIRMRGGTSLRASSDPLIVVDGVPLDGGDGVAGGRNPLNFINPSDIADMTVLKDASASAIYGSRGANGVIIITTKRGKSGKPQFSYDGSYSISTVSKRIDMLNREEFVFAVGRKGPRNLDDLGTSSTDWFDEILQTAQGHNHNIAASFGGETNSGRVSIGYQDLNGVLSTSNTERISASINLNQNLFNDKLKIVLSTKHTLINNRFAPNVSGQALTFDPTQSIFADDPTTGGYFEWSNPLATSNPVAQINQTFNIGKTQRNFISSTVSYDLPLEGLSAQVNYAYDESKGFSQNFQEVNQRVGRPDGSFDYFEDTRKSNLLEAYLNYNTKLPFGKLDLVSGYSSQDFTNDVLKSFGLETDSSIVGLGINDPLSFISSSKLAEFQPSVRSKLEKNFENKLISFWGRANLSIKDKYLITATLRKDGSTRFAPANRWGLFPSLAVGWRVIDEPFAERLNETFSNLKLRASWGVTGNQDFDDYIYLNLYEPGDERAQYILGSDTITTIRPNSVDPFIQWEATSSLNLGIDFGFFEGRLSGSLDLYDKLTTDLLFNVAFPIGTLTGDRAVTNIGEMKNKGIELVLNSVIIDQQDLKFNVAFNVAYNKNTISKLDNSNLPGFIGYADQASGISGDIGQTIQILKVGYPVTSFFVYEHKLDANGNPLPDSEDHNGDGNKNNLDMYVDLNNDGVINEADRRPYEKAAPDFIMGLTSNLQYKKIDIAMTFRSQIGGYVYNNVESLYGSYEGANGVFSPNNIHTSAFNNDFTNKQLFSDIYIENASFLRLDNITIGYSFNEFKNVKMRSYFTVSNLLTISGYNGIDPEAGFRGIDNNLYPRSTTFVMGVNLTLN